MPPGMPTRLAGWQTRKDALTSPGAGLSCRAPARACEPPHKMLVSLSPPAIEHAAPGETPPRRPKLDLHASLDFARRDAKEPACLERSRERLAVHTSHQDLRETLSPRSISSGFAREGLPQSLHFRPMRRQAGHLKRRQLVGGHAAAKLPSLHRDDRTRVLRDLQRLAKRGGKRSITRKLSGAMPSAVPNCRAPAATRHVVPRASSRQREKPGEARCGTAPRVSGATLSPGVETSRRQARRPRRRPGRSPHRPRRAFAPPARPSRGG